MKFLEARECPCQCPSECPLFKKRLDRKKAKRKSISRRKKFGLIRKLEISLSHEK